MSVCRQSREITPGMGVFVQIAGILHLIDARLRVLRDCLGCDAILLHCGSWVTIATFVLCYPDLLGAAARPSGGLRASRGPGDDNKGVATRLYHCGDRGHLSVLWT